MMCNAGGREHQAYWILAEHLPAFNAAIVGAIDVIAAFGDLAAAESTRL